MRAFAGSIDYAKLTHVNVAFENPRGDDSEMSFSTGNEPLIAKARANGVKVLVSIGGGAASTDKALLARYGRLLADAVVPARQRKRAAALLAEAVAPLGPVGAP